ncbi:uncharacterized protein LOC131596858 [Vicia villosa]|uniref:uncharacterized protein LOC131596858 n=1 Tax=Vicia villosa TaxID=3911 RepID=UPI00273B5DA9|nr:uncharacterized protein LOC131596858 [Vicia villosa]
MKNWTEKVRSESQSEKAVETTGGGGYETIMVKSKSAWHFQAIPLASLKRQTVSLRLIGSSYGTGPTPAHPPPSPLFPHPSNSPLLTLPPSQFPKCTFSPHRTPLNHPKCTFRSENPLPQNAVVSKPSPLEILKTSSVDRYTKEKSSIIVIGLNVHTAPVEMREKLSIPEAQWPQVIQELCALNHIEEAVVLR